MKQTFLVFLVAILLVGCDRQKYRFSQQSLQLTSEDCQEESCPSVSVDYLRCDRPELFAQRFNPIIRQRLAAILQITSGSPQPDPLQAAQQFLQDYQAIAQKFPSTPPYEATVVDSISFLSDSLVSLCSNVYLYTGGAHGYYSVSYLNFGADGKLLSAEELFSQPDSVAKVAQAYYQEMLREIQVQHSQEFWQEQPESPFELPENIGFEKNFLLLCYNPSQMVPYSQSPQIVRVPIEKIKQWTFFKM